MGNQAIYQSIKYIGTSSDTKPTVGVTVGSVFYEADSKNEYVFDGTSWNLIHNNVSLATVLSKEIDSIDVGKQSHAGTTTALNAVTATTTSDEVEVGAAGYKHIKVEVTGASFTSGNFAIALTGCETSNGTFAAINKQKDDATFTPIVVPTISTNATFIYVIPFVASNYIKITGTRTTDGTLTVKVTPFN